MLRLIAALLVATPLHAQTTAPEPRPAEGDAPEIGAPGIGAVETDAAGTDAALDGAAEADASGPATRRAPSLPRIAPEPRPDPTLAAWSSIDAPTGAEESAMRAAIEAMRAGRWSSARSEAARAGPVAEDVILWHELRARRGSWAEAEGFLERRADWPGLPLLKERIEGLIPVDLAPERVLAFFEDHAPATGAGALRLHDALAATGEREAARAALVEAWRTLPLTRASEEAMLRRAGDALAPHHEARLDMLLWSDPQAGAQRAMDHVGDDWRALARARIALRSGAPGVDALIEAVPARLQDDPGLAWERFLWRLERGREESAVEMMLARSVSAESLGRPELWARQRERWARQRMRAGQSDVAYALASGARLEEGSLHADLEWLSGFLALTDLGDPRLALGHFDTALEAVWTPISLGRMQYWRGRALEAMGREEEAQAAYAEGGRWQTSFYGQLAAERAGLPTDPALAGTERAPGLTPDLAESDVLRAVELLLAAGESQLAARFLTHLAEAQDEAGLAALGAWAEERGEPYLEVKLGKEAASMGGVLPRHNYPLHPMTEADLPTDMALALSIARRESEFHPGVASHVGAQGLMQLMPATAREVSGQLGLSYSRGRLTSDPSYNATLGSAYLAGLERRFGFNVPMMAAGYNAGPGRPARWARERGDPRDRGVDAVDWIEHIPFDETRNYVMRVMESVPVYRMRLSGEAEPLRVSEELKAR